jgi:serine/threonine protein kinase
LGYGNNEIRTTAAAGGGRDASTAPSANHRRLGDFEILRELGRGGMGVVYEARQISLNRKVALKLLATSLGLSSKAVIRFKREAEAAAKLHHTNIVPIYATGEHDGAHFYAMELIEGPGLDQVIAQRRDDPGNGKSPSAVTDPTASVTAAASSLASSGGGHFDSIARMIAEVADALDYAHAQGVVHRDIKPSNLLLSSDGRLHMNDFGLARMLEQPGMTVSGEFVGSPMYMSPEQIAVGRAPLDHRTDIYSLGATLYQVLTLESPFLGERRDQVIGQIIHKEPRRPRSINRKIPVDLETICLKAMEKDPDKRYQSAGDMAADLRAYVNRFAISARRVGPVGRALRWSRRHKALSVALTCMAVAILVAGTIGYRAHVADRKHRVEAIEQELEEANRSALYGEYDRALQGVQRAADLGASDGRLQLLRGEIALYRGEYETAAKELEQAVKALPQSQEARASLARTYFCMFQFDKELSSLREAEGLQSRTPGDYLAMGVAIGSDIEPDRGLALLDKAVELRVTPHALLARAAARISYAENTMDPAPVKLALDDAAAARTILPANEPMTVESVMEISMDAARLYGLMGMQPQRQAVLQAAADDIAALDPLPLNRARISARISYYYETDQLDEALRWEKARYEKYPDDHAAVAYSSELYRRGDTNDALALVRRSTDNLDTQFSCAMILPETGPAGEREAMEIYARMQQTATASTRVYTHYIPLVLGRTDLARADALALRATNPVLPVWHGWSNRVLDYQCGLLTDAQLLEAAGKSNWAHCEAYFNIGLRRLTEGDRPAALEMFRRCAATRVHGYLEYAMARGYVYRMEMDPQWPRWLPASAAGSPSTAPASKDVAVMGGVERPPN